MTKLAEAFSPAPGNPVTDTVRFIPLGGLNEVGMNCAAVVCGDAMIAIDCGIGFTNQEGAELVHPDFSWLVERAGFTEALVTGISTRWMRVRPRPMAIGANPAGARLSVAPMMMSTKKKINKKNYILSNLFVFVFIFSR